MIGIYNEPWGTSLGGSEYAVAVLAEALAESHEVELVHHRPSLTINELEKFSGRHLQSVRLRYVERLQNESGNSHNPWRRYQQARSWQSRLSEPYDLFIASIHHTPPFCHARKGILFILFPWYLPAYKCLEGESAQGSSLWFKLSHGYHKWEWERRMRTYQVKTAISDFTRVWTRRLWDIDCEVIHPPVDTNFRILSKENIVLTVGRFSIEGEGHGKKQAEMLAQFCSLHEGLATWQYFSVGGLGSTDKHQAHFHDLLRRGAACDAQILANISREKLKTLFERAKIFWHATGYGDDVETVPGLAEHFGISTVEAMAAGCVPVVINKGGQTEIVEHGVSGFLWDDFEQMKIYTRELAHNESLRERMAGAARERARSFSVDRFKEKFLALLTPLLD